MAALFRKTTLVIALAGWAGFAAQFALGETPSVTESPLWRYVHPNSNALVGAQWSKLQTSELGRFLQRRWIKDFSMPGTEFLKDVAEVLISSPGAKSDSDGEDQDPALLIAIRGNFNLTRVRLVLAKHGARLQTFDGIPIFRLKGKTEADPAFALVSSEIILVGQPQALFSTLERSKVMVNGDEDGAIVLRAKSLAARYECWALTDENGSIHNFLLSALMGKTLSPDSEGFEAGVSVRDGLAIDVVMKVHSERSAKLLQNNLNRLVRLADTQKPSDFMSLVPRFRITSNQSSVVLSLRMSNTELAAALPRTAQDSAASVGEAERTIDGSVAVASPPASEKLQPKLVIRIEGLDDGPRELPYKP